MDFSFLKALAGSARSQVSNLKSQSKRLHDISPEVFGQSFSKQVCNEAVARSNGFRNWREVESLASNIGVDRSLPAWHIHSRNKLHEICLHALIETDVEVSEMRPVIALGDILHASIPAVCLWAEQISARKVPGVIAIDTSISTFQKTPIGIAAKKLGLADIVQKFRVIDAREPSVALALSGTAREWRDAIKAGLSNSDQKVLEDSNVLAIFEHLVQGYGDIRNRDSGQSGVYDSYVLEQAARALRSPVAVNFSQFGGASKHYLEKYFKQDAPHFPVAETSQLVTLIDCLAKVISSVGVLLRHETLHRPTVVLFNSDNPVSVVIATLVHAMYYNRFISDRAIRPLLYCSTEKRNSLPSMLNFGSETVVLNGETDMRAPIWDTHSTRNPVFVSTEDDGIRVSGKWISLVSDASK